jgi:hypothetical protein
MFRRTKKDVQKGRIALAFAVREALQKESPLEAAQPGWQISGEVVILVEQPCRGLLFPNVDPVGPYAAAGA